MRMADGTKIKTKVDEDSDKVKVKTKGADGSASPRRSPKNGELDVKAKDARRPESQGENQARIVAGGFSEQSERAGRTVRPVLFVLLTLAGQAS
ncbi:MAG: hypothetical protein WKG07_47510 [Hymenobacter sp.]